MDITKLITEKEVTLALLKREMTTIERQLSTLRAAAAASEPTEFELMLISKKPTEFTGNNVFSEPIKTFEPPVKIIPQGGAPRSFHLSENGKVTVRVRNPKGLLKKIARMVLTQENQTFDALEKAINTHAEKPVSRAAVRTLMMNLKIDGYAVSDAPGVFRLAEKGEAATDSRSVTASIVQTS